MTESSEAIYSSFEDIMNDGEISEIMVKRTSSNLCREVRKKDFSGV